MARTLGGDLLALLAHTGLQTAGNIGTQFVSSYLKPGMEVREAAGKALLGVMGTGTEAQREAAAKALHEQYGMAPWPTAPVVNPSGSEIVGPEGARLTAPTSTPLTELAPGYTPRMGLVQTTPRLEDLKAQRAMGLTPEEQKTAFFPKDATLEAAKMNLNANLVARAYEKEQDRLSRERIAQHHDEQMGAFRGLTLEIARDRLTTTQDKNQRDAWERELNDVTNLQKQIMDIEIPTEKRDMLKQQVNAIIQGSQNPTLKRYPIYTEDVAVPGTGWTPPLVGGITGAFGATKVKVPAGQKPQATKTLPTQALVFPRRIRAGGQEVIVNSQEEYDALKEKFSK